jgi:cysteine protease ATG4
VVNAYLIGGRCTPEERHSSRCRLHTWQPGKALSTRANCSFKFERDTRQEDKMLDSFWHSPHALGRSSATATSDLFLLGNRYTLHPDETQNKETESESKNEASDTAKEAENNHDYARAKRNQPAALDTSPDSALPLHDRSIDEIESTYVDFASFKGDAVTTENTKMVDDSATRLSAENGQAEVVQSPLPPLPSISGVPHGAEQIFNDSISQIKTFFGKLANNGFDLPLPLHDETINMLMPTIEWPEDFLIDLNTRIWFTYRFGFPLIERDKNGPTPLSLGSLFRGTLDINNMNKGFTSDSGWGCMIRTSQSLLANALLNLELGRQWRLYDSSKEDMQKHWEIVQLFADVPEAQFSIHNFVSSAARYCGKKPGEWFGPSNAAKSIQHLCNESKISTKLKVYVSTDSGDIFEDEVLKLAGYDGEDSTTFTPILILCGVRLGVSCINEIYWDFLKLVFQTKYGVGIAGGRPSSSHYFFGFQDNSLFYLDPHIPQPCITLDEEGSIPDEMRIKLYETIHTTKVRTLELSKIDPSMLIGFLVESLNEFNDLRNVINSFDSNKRFLNICKQRPRMRTLSSEGSELEGFIDLGVESMDEDEEDDIEAIEDRMDKEEASFLLNDEDEVLPIEEPMVNIEMESKCLAGSTSSQGGEKELRQTILPSVGDDCREQSEVEEPLVEVPRVKEVIVMDTEDGPQSVDGECESDAEFRAQIE